MGTDVITAHLEELRSELGRRRDVDDVVAEAEDHMRAHVDVLVEAGTEAEEAARVAVRSFGDARAVARAHLRTRSGRLAVPTAGTRAAGSCAIAAGVLWVAFLVIWGVGSVLESALGGAVPFEIWYLLGVLALAGAVALMGTTAIAVRDRHGGALGPLWYVGVVALALGALCVLGVGWAVPVWMVLLGVGSACIAVAMLRRPIAPLAPAVVWLLALPSGLAVYALAQIVELGRPDEFGDRPAATFAGLTVGSLLSGYALVATGRWLRDEQPYVDLEGLPAPPARP